MTISKLKIEIAALENRLHDDRMNFYHKKIMFTQYSAKKMNYLWLLLPITAFIIGFRRDITLLTVTLALMRIQAWNWVRRQLSIALLNLVKMPG